MGSWDKGSVGFLPRPEPGWIWAFRANVTAEAEGTGFLTVSCEMIHTQLFAQWGWGSGEQA